MGLLREEGSKLGRHGTFRSGGDPGLADMGLLGEEGLKLGRHGTFRRGGDPGLQTWD